MTDVSANETVERVLRSLKENSAEFQRKRHAERNARIRKALVICLVFAIGLAVGALLMDLG
jgi:ferric-dicitrate binding protein FerR (iron transport regulator)